jgi:hypothetical protein
MDEVKVYLRFDAPLTDEQRGEFMRRLRAVNAPDFDLVERDDDIWLEFPEANDRAALTRVQTVVVGLCNGTDIEPSLIGRSLEGGFRAS